MIIKRGDIFLAALDPVIGHEFHLQRGHHPPDVWVHDPETGGGRIIGEACHFIDLLS
jgi:predicted dehydrogenase